VAVVRSGAVKPTPACLSEKIFMKSEKKLLQKGEGCVGDEATNGDTTEAVGAPPAQ